MARFAINKPVQEAVVGVSVVLMILPTIFIALRFWAKRLSGRTWDWSDTFITISWAISVPYTAMNIVAVTEWGLGYHILELEELYGATVITEFLKFMVAEQVLWPMSVSSVKFSVLCFYLKLFKGTHSNWQRYMAISLIVVHTLYSLATIILAFSICQPLSKYWNPTMKEGHCGDTLHSYIATGTVDFITDFLIVSLPLPSFFVLQAKMSTKVWLLCTFVGGYVTSGMALARLILLTKIDISDLTYSGPTVLVLGTAQPAMGLICVCIPMLQPLLRNSALLSTKSGSNDNTNPRSRTREWSKVADERAVRLGNQDDSSETELRQLPKDSYTVHVSKPGRLGLGEKSNSKKELITVEQEWDVTSTSNNSL